ncbi:Hexose transport-related protein [Mycena sanguinolenta]|uniref:Hexose transport-related protein n=1 Tax=Mycena sanguinolenta TaxID=230812 RepID=A0A8H6YIF2_9AGAR|nr:Hexose transport-related protein [Mycena sanguinolenta]
MSNLQAVNAARRAELAGPAGLRGVMKNPRLFRLAIITTLGALCYGYEQGAYSQVLVMDAFVTNPKFSRIANDSSFKGWSVSTLGLGGWAGALANGYLCDTLSRRWTLLIGSIICLLGTGLTTGAQNSAFMFVGRFFIGLAVGSLSAVVPLCNDFFSVTNKVQLIDCSRYNSEISPPELRGTIVSIQQLAIVTGICISFLGRIRHQLHLGDQFCLVARLPRGSGYSCLGACDPQLHPALYSEMAHSPGSWAGGFEDSGVVAEDARGLGNSPIGIY